MIINKKIKRTMRENKSQYIGSVILIVLNCLLFTMMGQLASNMTSMTNSFVTDNVQEDASFVTSIPLTNIAELESRFDAKIEEGSTFDYTFDNGKTLRIFSENTKVNIPAILKGNALGTNEILIDPGYANANGIQIGSNIKIMETTFKVAGFMSLPNYIYVLKSENDILGDPNTFGIAMIGKKDYAAFNRGSSFYSIAFNSDKSGIAAQETAFRNYFKSNNINISQWSDIADNKRVSYVTVKVEAISKATTTVPVVILLLSCILTSIVLYRLINQESVIIGTLYAQGYRRKEIKKHYMMYPITIALSGSIIGTAAGALLLKPMLNFMLTYFNLPVKPIVYNPLLILISLFIPLIFLYLSANFVLNKVLKLSPVALMRGERQKSEVNLIERKLKLDKFKFSTKFKLRQQLRSLSRLTFLFLGVVVATMLLLFGFTAKSSIDYLLKDNLRNTFKFEYEYIYNSLHTEQPPAGAQPFSSSKFTLTSDSKIEFNVVGISSGTSYIILKDKSGKTLTTDKIIITKPLADKLKVKAGDTLNLVNKLDSKEYTLIIDAIADTYIGEYIFMPLDKFNAMLKYPDGSYIGLWSKDKLDIPEHMLYGVQSINDSINAFDTLLAPLQTTIGTIAAVSFLIGLLVIYIVTSMIIEENKKNISMMKIFGYRKKEVNSLILNSSSFMIVLGYIVGIPLILATMTTFYGSFTESLNLTLPVKISYAYILVGFAVIYCAYVLSKYMTKKKINRISMSEALKSGIE